MSLADRRTQYDLIQTFKIIHGIDDVNANIWFELVGENPARLTRNTSHPLNITSKNPRNEIRKNFFSNRVIEKWNMLPSDIKDSRNVSSFKRSIVQMLLNK